MRVIKKHWLQLVVSVILVFLSSCANKNSNKVTPNVAFAAQQSYVVEQETLGTEAVETIALTDRIAQQTWTYLHSDWATTNHLPWSWRSESIAGGDYANTTEMGLYALSWLAAYDLQESWSPTWVETEAEISAVLDQLRAWQSGTQVEQPNGPNAYNNSVFYQWYWISETPPVVSANEDDHLVPSIDNAWLAASLITIRAYAEAHGHPTLTAKTDNILADMDFMLWYDTTTHQFYWGTVENPQGGTLANYYSNENRIINFVARSLGHFSKEEFLRSWDAFEQSSASYDGITVEKVAWDGSFFTYATPALFIQEMDTSYGENTILPAAQAQIAYAQNQGYEAWGLSDCFDTGSGDYVQQGSPPAAMDGDPETKPGLVTAHASALALITPLETETITNLETISNTFSCAYHPEYGFTDSVLVKPDAPDYGQCSDRFSALAQEWMFLSLVNYKTGFIWKYFYLDAGVQAAHDDIFQRNVYLPFIIKEPTPIPWKYEREAEKPNEFTVGAEVDRSAACNQKVHGQFGTTAFDPWPAKSGYVIYTGINFPTVYQLYLRLRYSKGSTTSEPIMVYIDNESDPRVTFYPIEQEGWNAFSWTGPINLGEVTSGSHAIKLATKGQQYGVADLDMFCLADYRMETQNCGCK